MIQTQARSPNLRQDAPRVVCGRLDGIVFCELVDEIVAGEAADGEQQESDDDEADASARISILRRPRASQMASAATASATSHIQSATARRTFVTVCAVSS